MCGLLNGAEGQKTRMRVKSMWLCQMSDCIQKRMTRVRMGIFAGEKKRKEERKESFGMPGASRSLIPHPRNLS
jgi:hypothetical protein